jgi:hypothetical protein
MKLLLSEAARPKGLEPSPYGLEIRCSIRLSYGRKQRGQYVARELQKSSGNAQVDGAELPTLSHLHCGRTLRIHAISQCHFDPRAALPTTLPLIMMSIR